MNKSIEHIYVEFKEGITSYIFSYTKDLSIAQDLAHDVILKINTKLDQLKDESKLQHWIFRISKNTIIDHFRANKKAQEVINDFADFNNNFEEENPSADFGKCLSPLIDDLSKEDNLLITKIDVEGHSQKDVAQELEMNYTTLKSKVQRARKKLKTKLADCCRQNNCISENEELTRNVDCKC